MNPIQTIEVPVNFQPEKIILVAGAGQNVGKTSFACELIEHLKSLDQKVYAIKISPHFHQVKPPKTIFSDGRFILSLEDQKESGKDSSRMLNAGADQSFFLQVNDEFLADAFGYTMSFVPKDVVAVVESGGLRRLIKPALFFYLMRTGEQETKYKATQDSDIAGQRIIFDGNNFDYSPKNIQIIEGSVRLIV